MLSFKNIQSRATLCILSSSLAFFAIACGDSDDDAQDVKKTVYAELVVADSVTETDDGTAELTTASTCSLNAESDFLKVVLSGSKSRLIVKVQDASASTFTCTQETDGFDNCFVYAEVPTEAGAEKSNGYSMATDADAGTEDKTFNYAGTCQVTLTELTPSVQGSVNCTGLVQTKWQGTPTNPIRNDVTAAVSVEDFHCTPK